MVHTVSRIAGAIALAASLSVIASPALAARVYLPVILDRSGAQVTVPAVQSASEHRDWGSWGGRQRDNVSVGDVLTGVLIIGGIAAIASAASRSKRDRENTTYRYPNQQGEGARYGEPVPQRSWNGSDRNIDRAVDACVSSVERGELRVGTVDSVGRIDDGWRVSGRMSSGSEFSCSVDRDGNLRGVAASPDHADKDYDGTGEDKRPDYPG